MSDERRSRTARSVPAEGDGRAAIGRARSIPGQPQPWLIADPEELGEALNWMLQTARGPAPGRVQDLAKHLGISPAQIYNYISGTKVPPPDKWDMILELFGITGTARGEWATAADRVRERRRIQRTRDRASERSPSPDYADASVTNNSTTTNESEPAEAPPPEPRAESPVARRRIIAAAAAVSLVAAVVALTVFGREHPGRLANPPDVECLRPGSATTWLNHHSRRYLAAAANLSEPAMAAAPPGPSRPPTMTALSRGDTTAGVCATQISAATQAGAGGCLAGADPDQTAVRWAPCNMSAQQLWIVENHWPNEGIMWKRIRPASDIDSCLQEQPQGDGSASVTLQPCGTDWSQQWSVS